MAKLNRELNRKIMFNILCYKSKTLKNGKLSYIRQKTGKKIVIPISTDAMQIVENYMKESTCANDYVFPILNKSKHITEQQKYNRKHKVLGHVDKCLKEISQQAGIK